MSNARKVTKDKKSDKPSISSRVHHFFLEGPFFTGIIEVLRTVLLVALYWAVAMFLQVVLIPSMTMVLGHKQELDYRMPLVDVMTRWGWPSLFLVIVIAALYIMFIKWGFKVTKAFTPWVVSKLVRGQELALEGNDKLNDKTEQLIDTLTGSDKETRDSIKNHEPARPVRKRRNKRTGK